MLIFGESRKELVSLTGDILLATLVEQAAHLTPLVLKGRAHAIQHNYGALNGSPSRLGGGTCS